MVDNASSTDFFNVLPLVGMEMESLIQRPSMRLAVIAPYRNRAEHLSQFVPHLAAYFTRDKLDGRLPVCITVVEQAGTAPFNRGLIKNIGFKLMRESADYVCFHDVDYLPVWADYRYPDQPTMIVWYGCESRPIDPAEPSQRVQLTVENCFGGVTLIRNEQFERANGFSNSYWGWGCEDVDLRYRLEASGCRIAHRKGTFLALDHRHEGFDKGQQPTAAHQRNAAIAKSRWVNGRPITDGWRKEGLCDAHFEIVSRRPLPMLPDTRPDIRVEHIVVNFQGPPITG